MEALKEIEEIKQLKARYFRFLDAKNWEDLADCLTLDVTFSYPPQAIKVEGKAALVENFKKRHAVTKTAHTGSMPEIELLDGDNAKGIWFMTDYIIDTDSQQQKSTTQGFGRYYESYFRENGKWLIQSILLERIMIISPDVKIILS